MIVKPTFYQPKSRTIVMVRFSYRKQQIRLSTGISVPEKYWNKTKELPHINYKDYVKVRDDLQKILELILDYTSKDFSVNKIKDQIKHIAEVKNERLPNFVEAMKVLIEFKEESKIKTTAFTTVLNNIIKFQEDNNLVLELSDIDVFFPNKYVNWSNGRFSTNTLTRTLKRIREVKLFAIANEMIPDDGFEKVKWKLKKFETDSFVLTPEEIDRLIEYDPPKNYLKHTKARWLATYLTGVRISDFKKLNDVRIIKDEEDIFFTFRTAKTDVPVVIPCLPELKKIIEEYSGFPSPISDQKQNEYLKELFEPLLNYDIKIRKSIDYELVEVNVKAYTQVTNHTARRNFATVFYQMGVPLATIQLILGHTKPSQTEEYIKLDSMQKRMSAKELLKILKRNMGK